MSQNMSPAVRRRPAALRRAATTVVESLERRSLMAANPVITEFVASNSNGLVDGNGVKSDWVEIQNQGDQPVNLQGWSLTDNANQPAKWTFPAKTLAAGAYLVVIADSSSGSGPDSKGYLHTNFSLSADGENLSLRRPDGTVASQFAANNSAYPKQAADVSYGTAVVSGPAQNLIVSGAPARAAVGTAATDASAWTSPGFNDSAWKSGTTGVGFDSTSGEVGANLLAQFSANNIAAADNAPVQSWNASAGTGTAVATSNQRRPTFVQNGINGMPALRFNGNAQLNVTNQSLNGAADFTVAVVFRTTQVGVTGAQWSNNTGLVDASAAGTANDWGVSLNNAGQIAAGVGNPDTTVYSAAGQNNGVAHVAIFTKSGNRLAVSIDGADPVVTATTAAAARSVANFYIGALNGGGNRFVGDIGEVRLYKAALSDDSVQSLAGRLAEYWNITPAVRSFTSSIGLDLKAEMLNVASSAYVRVPFTVADTSSVTSLLLKMKYDDGFVAYLNGVEVARRNAPGGTVTYASAATATRPDAAALAAETIDVSAFAGLLQGNGATNVLAVRALNGSAADGDLLVVPELVAANVTVGPAFMTVPTPAAANAPGYNGFAAVVTASVPHGYYTSPVGTTLTSSSPGATIVYTTDGSTPTLANGTKVPPASATATPSATLNLSSTTVLRMAAFRDGFVQSAVTSASYLFTSDIVQQPESKPSGAYWDVGLDADVVNAQQTYSVQEALVAVPTMSLTIDNEAMFGNTGIYKNPLGEGDAWERPVSVEYFDPNDAGKQLTVNAGIRITGAVSRETSRPKKNFKLYFRSDYGASSVAFPFFGAGDPQTDFEHLSLRAGHNYAWANDGNVARGDYLRDPFARETQLALTGKASRNGWVQLYINGQYWGLYNTLEDFDGNWAAANYGGDADDYDIIKPNDNGGIEADDGNLDAWNELFRTTDNAYRENGVSDAEYAQIAAQLDVPGLIDYMLSNFYRGDRDSPVVITNNGDPRNFVALHNRADPNGKIVFTTQDGEISLETADFDRTDLYGNYNPAHLYQQLRSNAKFRRQVADRINQVFYGNGPLTVAANQARYRALMAQIDKAIVGESARWGNGNRTTTGLTNVGTRDGSWTNETNWILNTFMAGRTAFVTNLLKADIPESALSGPVTFVNGSPNAGGVVASGSTVQIGDYNNPPGKLYYTLDGTDPRTAAGTLNPTAIAYAGQFVLPGSRTLSVRSLRDGVWSPLTVSVYALPTPSLRLAEMMYHPTVPAGGTYAKDDYEYLKIVNTGTTPVSLGGMTLTSGVFGTVADGVTLAPGAAGYLVKNAAAFAQAYGGGKQVLGVYTDNLSNGGEQVRLFDPGSGTAIFDFIYQDTWYPTTDNGGYALQVKDLGPAQGVSTVLGVASAWQAALASKPATQRLAGDADGNGRVDFADFSLVQGAFGTRVGQAGYLSGADFNADGRVDFDDYSLVQANFGVIS